LIVKQLSAFANKLLNLITLVSGLKSHFDVIEVTDKISAIESTEDSFGYKGLHMDLRLKKNRLELPEYAVCALFRFEIQIKTIIQDSWSALDHKIKYKKKIPNHLKRRINVLSALFELADREFRQIRDSTLDEIQKAHDENADAVDQIGIQFIGADHYVNSVNNLLDAFTFLKIAGHFFKDYMFEPHKVDGFVQEITEWMPGMTRANFNSYMKDNIAIVKQYKQQIEEKSTITDKFNPYTVMRHCLYRGNKEVFSKALSTIAKESFDKWLQENI
jgi:putative GTP pyrophosphokinase